MRKIFFIILVFVFTGNVFGQGGPIRPAQLDQQILVSFEKFYFPPECSENGEECFFNLIKYSETKFGEKRDFFNNPKNKLPLPTKFSDGYYHYNLVHKDMLTTKKGLVWEGKFIIMDPNNDGIINLKDILSYGCDDETQKDLLNVFMPRPNLKQVCNARGGTFTTIDSKDMCIIPGENCPYGLKKNGYSQTKNVRVEYEHEGTCGLRSFWSDEYQMNMKTCDPEVPEIRVCETGSHDFSNNAVESCKIEKLKKCGIRNDQCYSTWYYDISHEAEITHTGCVLP